MTVITINAKVVHVFTLVVHRPGVRGAVVRGGEGRGVDASQTLGQQGDYRLRAPNHSQRYTARARPGVLRRRGAEEVLHRISNCSVMF